MARDCFIRFQNNSQEEWKLKVLVLNYTLILVKHVSMNRLYPRVCYKEEQKKLVNVEPMELPSADWNAKDNYNNYQQKIAWRHCSTYG